MHMQELGREGKQEASSFFFHPVVRYHCSSRFCLCETTFQDISRVEPLLRALVGDMRFSPFFGLWLRPVFTGE